MVQYVWYPSGAFFVYILNLEVLFVHVCKPYDQVSGKIYFFDAESVESFY